MFWTKKWTKQVSPADFEVRMHGSVTVGAKWQVVIPKDVRDMLDINEGDTLLTITKYGRFVGFVKSEDVKSFIELLKKESNIA